MGNLEVLILYGLYCNYLEYLKYFMCINKQVHKWSQVINNQCIVSVQAKVLKEDSNVITQHPIIEQITSFNHKFYNSKLNYSQSSD